MLFGVKVGKMVGFVIEFIKFEVIEINKNIFFIYLLFSWY